MDINSIFPSNYLRAVDLNGHKVNCRVRDVSLESLGDETKPVLYFSGKDKGLVLNKTNAQIIAATYGPETDNWLDKEVTLYPAKVQFQGRMVDAIRVEVPVPHVAPGEDDIPF